MGKSGDNTLFAVSMGNYDKANILRCIELFILDTLKEYTFAVSALFKNGNQLIWNHMNDHATDNFRKNLTVNTNLSLWTSWM